MRYLESVLREECAETGRKKVPCGCEMKQLTRTGTCQECLKLVIQQLKDGIGTNSLNYVSTGSPIPDSERVRGCPEMKRNLNNND